MVSHVKFEALDADYPATLSPVIVNRLLRDELRYDGAVCTDSMEMKAISDHYGAGESAVLAALAGIDLLLFSHFRENQEQAYRALLEAARSGRLPQTALDDASRRIAALKARYAITAAPDPALVCSAEHVALAQRAARAGTVLLHNYGVFPLTATAQNTVLVEFGSVLDSQAMERGDLGSFASLVSKRAPDITCFTLSVSDPKPALLAKALEAAEKADMLVLATRSAHLMPEQEALANNLIRRARRLILICLRNPFDAGLLVGADAALCTCGDSAPSLEAAASALFGEFTPTGRLPLSIE